MKNYNRINGYNKNFNNDKIKPTIAIIILITSRKNLIQIIHQVISITCVFMS